LLFSVLAVGALVDPTLPPFNAEARHYQRLARAALCLQSVLSERSMVTIQVLHLMSMYYGMSGIESNAELCYSFLNFAGQVALQVSFEPRISQPSDRPLTSIIRLGFVCHVTRQPLIRG
jgi:hypothetical protein